MPGFFCCLQQVSSADFHTFAEWLVLRLGYQEHEGIKIPVVTIARKARDWEQAREFKKLLGLDSQKDVYILDSKGNLPRDDTIDLELRSLIGTFYFVSHGVEVPVRDSEMGHAMMTRGRKRKAV